MSNFVERMAGAAALRATTYEEVEADSSATVPAIGVVLLSSLAAAIGTGKADPRSLVGIVAAAIITWVLWVLLTLFIGTRLLPEPATKADFGQIVRTTGFSSSVGILRILGMVPVIGPLIFGAVTVWMLLTFIVAIRQALDYTSTARAVAVCLLGWVIHAILFFGFVSATI